MWEEIVIAVLIAACVGLVCFYTRAAIVTMYRWHPRLLQPCPETIL